MPIHIWHENRYDFLKKIKGLIFAGDQLKFAPFLMIFAKCVQKFSSIHPAFVWQPEPWNRPA